MPERPKFEVGTPVRVKETAEIRNVEGVTLHDVTYVICFRREPTDFNPETVLVLSRPVPAPIMEAIRKCAAEVDVIKTLEDAGYASYFVPEKDVIIDVRALNQRPQ